jgi:hypothetical protein
MARPSRKRSGQAIRDKAGITIFSSKNYLHRTDEAVPRLYIRPRLPSCSYPSRSKHNYFIIFKTIVLQTLFFQWLKPLATK